MGDSSKRLNFDQYMHEKRDPTARSYSYKERLRMSKTAKLVAKCCT